MHLLGTSVLTLVILPLAFSFECANISISKVTEDYRYVIEPRLQIVKAVLDKLNLNCTLKTFREPKNAQSSLRKICRVNQQLSKQSETKQGISVLPPLVKEINQSLQCWCMREKESSRSSPKWKVCKVKHILTFIQTYFEQYNASQSIHKETQKSGRTSKE